MNRPGFRRIRVRGQHERPQATTLLAGPVPDKDLSVTEAMDRADSRPHADTVTTQAAPSSPQSAGQHPHSQAPARPPWVAYPQVPQAGQQDRRAAVAPPTEPFTPDFTRPAEPVGHNRIQPLPPATPSLFTAGTPEGRKAQLGVLLKQVDAIAGACPAPDSTDPAGYIAAMAAQLRRYDDLTGWNSPLSDPAAWPMQRLYDGWAGPDSNPAPWPVPGVPGVPQDVAEVTGGAAS